MALPEVGCWHIAPGGGAVLHIPPLTGYLEGFGDVVVNYVQVIFVTSVDMF